jgi:regulator of RNase E activity RraA
MPRRRRSAPPPDGDVYAGLVAQLEQLATLPGPAVVVFQDLDNPPVSATFGEIMCSTYQAFGAVGLITSGAGRDLDQVEAIGFPCFTDGTICSHGYCQVVRIGEPASVGGVTVYTGDLLHGDRNGVTTIPVELAEACAEGCAGFMAAEAVILDYLKSGKPTVAGFAAAQKECKARIAALGRRLRGE